MKFNELGAGEKAARQNWLAATRSHLGDEHRRWGDSLFKLLILANTGGVAVVAGLISNDHSFRSSICLQLSLSFFAIGVSLALIAIYKEFSDVSRSMKAWDRSLNRYLNGEIHFDEFYEPTKNRITLIDRVIGWAPGIFFAVGLINGLLFVWA